ncbi:MAG: hypothetical protein IKZ13_04055 [Akkermansia sp.]|nr:hypothetical protein [Akkermansia sp.]
MRENLSLKASKQGGVYVTILLIFLMAFGWAWMMQEESEGLSKFNTLSLNESLSAVVQSYSYWNPRIGESIYFLLDCMGGYKLYMLLIHPTCVTISLLSMFRLGIGKWPWEIENGRRASFVLLVLFLCAFSLIDTDWFLGNMNWFYPTSVALLFFSLIERFFNGNFKISSVRLLALLPLAIIVGMSNENTSAVSSVCYAACGLYYIWKKRSFCVSIGYVVIGGCLLLAFIAFYVPLMTSNVRVGGTHWELSPLFIIKNSLLVVPNWIFMGICFWRILFIVILLLVYARCVGVKVGGQRAIFLILVLFMLWGVAALTPLWGAPRSYIPLQLVACTIIGRLVYKVSGSGAAFRWSAATITTVTIFLVLATSVIPRTYSLWYTFRNWSLLECATKSAKERGFNTLTVYPHQFYRSPLMPKCKLPQCVFNSKIRPAVPLHAATLQNLENIQQEHQLLNPLKSLVHADVYKNRAQARRLGLEAVYYIVEPKKKD